MERLDMPDAWAVHVFKGAPNPIPDVTPLMDGDLTMYAGSDEPAFRAVLIGPVQLELDSTRQARIAGPKPIFEEGDGWTSSYPWCREMDLVVRVTIEAYQELRIEGMEVCQATGAMHQALWLCQPVYFEQRSGVPVTTPDEWLQ